MIGFYFCFSSHFIDWYFVLSKISKLYELDCHVLSACPQLHQMYTCRHNKALEEVIDLLRANQQPVTGKEPIIQFLKEGECPVRKQKNPNMKLLNGDSVWQVSTDLKDISQQFPVHNIQTEKRLDIVVWSD